MAHKNKGEAVVKQASGTVAKHALGFGRGRARSTGRESLKSALRALLNREAETEGERELQNAARRWFHNKKANDKKPQQGIGRTNKIKTSSNKR